MTRTMLAARLTSPGHFEVQEHPVPRPAAGQVLIALARAGLCGGDLQQYKNATGALPFIPGHEGCGTVAEAPGLAALEGQRVVFDPQVHWCGRCEWCGRGHTEICAERRYLGAHAHGTFAQYVVVPSDRLLVLPESVGWDDAACVHGLAGPVFASQRFQHEVGESVLVLGPGAAGLLFVQLAKQCLGATQVMLAGRSAHRLELGRALGSDAVVNTQQEDLRSVLPRPQGAGVSTSSSRPRAVRHCASNCRHSPRRARACCLTRRDRSAGTRSSPCPSSVPPAPRVPCGQRWN